LPIWETVKLFEISAGLAGALASSSTRMIFWLGMIAALAILGLGWLCKVVLITRAPFKSFKRAPTMQKN